MLHSVLVFRTLEKLTLNFEMSNIVYFILSMCHDSKESSPQQVLAFSFLHIYTLCEVNVIFFQKLLEKKVVSR